jgi:hypothetical protein
MSMRSFHLGIEIEQMLFEEEIHLHKLHHLVRLVRAARLVQRPRAARIDTA